MSFTELSTSKISRKIKINCSLYSRPTQIQSQPKSSKHFQSFCQTHLFDRSPQKSKPVSFHEFLKYRMNLLDDPSVISVGKQRAYYVHRNFPSTSKIVAKTSAIKLFKKQKKQNHWQAVRKGTPQKVQRNPDKPLLGIDHRRKMHKVLKYRTEQSYFSPWLYKHKQSLFSEVDEEMM